MKTHCGCKEHPRIIDGFWVCPTCGFKGSKAEVFLHVTCLKCGVKYLTKTKGIGTDELVGPKCPFCNSQAYSERYVPKKEKWTQKELASPEDLKCRCEIGGVFREDELIIQKDYSHVETQSSN